MLILTRHKKEVIRIGSDISIHVLHVSGKRQVKIGIQAPKEIPVHREEIFNKDTRPKS